MPSINEAYQWAIRTCEDTNVRYSQTYRDQQTIDGLTYYDCSSFIWYALIAGGFNCVAANNGDTWPFVTWTMEDVLQRLGFVEVSRTGEIKAGDIGFYDYLRWNPNTQTYWHDGHTEMCYRGGNGEGIFMGARGQSLPAQQQVSIKTRTTSGTTWQHIYRYGNGLEPKWHNKNVGAYSRDSVECQENVLKIMSILIPLGWTDNAIAGLCGNIEAESGFNPWRWQNDSQSMSMGYGLFQYTPASKYVGDSLASTMQGYNPNYPVGNGGQDDGTAQILYMLQNSVPDGYGGRGAQYYPTSQYPLSLSDFASSTDSPENLASAWLKNFERAGVEVEQQRRENARYWYEWITNHEYIPSYDSKMKILLAKQHWIRKRRMII